MEPVHIDVKRFRDELEIREKRDNQLKQFVRDLGLQTLEIFYEDILADETEVHKNIYDFIGVPYIATKGIYFKNTSDNLRNSLSNFDELKNSFHGTQYEDMFDEIIITNGSKQ